MQWTKALAALEEIKNTGVGFWSRNSDQSITINIRGEHGNDPNQWKNAREVESFFGIQVKEGIKPDPQSGTLVIRLRPFKQ